MSNVYTTNNTTPFDYNAVIQNKSAQALINGDLASFGLSNLGDWAWKQYLAGVPLEQIFLDMQQTPEYKARFPGMEALVKSGRAISEAEYIGIESQYKQIAQSVGFPEGMLTPEYMGKAIAGNVAPTEFNDRINQWVQYSYKSDPIMRQQLSALYGGIQPGELAAYVMDPENALPHIQKQFLSAQLSASAVRSGFGGLTVDEAQHLAELGISPEQAQQGFQTLNQDQNIMGATKSSGKQSITRQDQLNAIFDGNSMVQKEIERRIGQNKANFAGQSAVGQDRQGQSGYASANT